jgi:flagellar hook-associated protein 3 FlgL
MTITATGTGAYRLARPNDLLSTRKQLDDLQRQLGTGKKSDTYAGLGLERGLAVGLRSRLSALEAFGS